MRNVGRRFAWGAAGLAGAVLVIVMSADWWGPGPGMAVMKAFVAARFPDVEHVSAGEVASWMGSDGGSGRLWIVDVRSPEEYGVSHVPGAVRWTAGGGLADRVAPEDRIVAYCSVGYRSSLWVRRMREEAGWTNAVNLEGSIFAWANEGRPMEDGGGERVSAVHPFGPGASFLVRRGIRNYGLTGRR